MREKFAVVAVAYTGTELLDTLRETPADALLLDLSLPDRHGLDILSEVRAVQPMLRILVVTMHVDRILAEAALAAGAAGFVPKNSAMEELDVALAEVLAGRRYLSPRLPRTSHRMSLDASHLATARLTSRQHAILHRLGQGRTSREIADELRLSVSAITWHRSHLRAVLGLSSEWELLRFAILVGLASSETGLGGEGASR